MSYLESKSGSIQETVKEMQKHLKDNAYQQLFKKELEKTGKGIGAMSDMEKKDFFNKLDKKYKGKKEDLDSKDEPSVKDVANQLKKAVKAHGQQAKDLEKAIKSEETIVEFSSQQIKMAYGILNDPRYKQGNYSGAVKAIEKLAKGLSKHPDVANALKRANENVETGPNTDQMHDYKKAKSKDPKAGEKEPMKMNTEEESFDIEKLKEDVNTLWSNAAKDLEEMKKNAKYMKAQDVAPDSDTESEKEKKGKTLVGSAKSKIETEPKVDYQK